MPLTDAQIKSFKPQAKRVRKSDGGGLYVEVAPTGVRTFRLAYRFAGEQRTLMIGLYPDMRLAEARHAREEAKAALRRGEDPRGLHTVAPPPEPAAAANGSTWNEVADDFIALRRRDGVALRTADKLRYQIEPTRALFGTRDIRTIKPADIIAVIRPIETSGRVETAHGVRACCSQVFQFAIAEGRADSDPAAMVGRAMVKRGRGGHAGLKDPKAIGKMMATIRAYSASEPQTRTALLLSAYLFPRNAEIRGMTWEEINWDGALWSVPGPRMKMKLPHLVPLPTQAIALLKEIKSWTGRSVFVLPSPRDPARMFAGTVFNSSLRAMGIPGSDHVHHGFRITASTTLNELGWNRDWIERQLAHTEGNKVRGAYNQAEYIEGRTEMMQAYADWLDEQEKKFGSADRVI